MRHLLGSNHLGSAVLTIQRNRVSPVGTVIILDFVVAATLVAVDVRVVEDGLDRVAGRIGVSVLFGVQIQRELGGHRSIAAAHHLAAVCALGGKQSIDGVVGIGGGDQVVIAGHQHISACAVSIKGSKVLFVNGNRDRFGLTRCQNGGLAKFNQLHGRNLNLVFLGIITVRLGNVELHGLLAGVGVAHVGYVNGHVVGAVALLFRLEIAVRKVGVGLAVAEGVSNNLAVIVIAYIGCAQNRILVTGFGVAVAQIHTFLIDGVGVQGGFGNEHIALLALNAEFCGILIYLIAVVDIDGVHLMAHPEGVRQTTGRHILAGQQLADCGAAVLTQRTDPHSRINAVLLIVEEISTQHTGAIVDEDDFLENALILQRLQAGKGVHLALRQVQEVAIVAVGGAVHAQVRTLAADTTGNVDGCVAILGKGVPGSLGDVIPVNTADVQSFAAGPAQRAAAEVDAGVIGTCTLAHPVAGFRGCVPCGQIVFF